MYIERVPNRNSRPAVLLREGWREGKRIRKRTLANISDWPEHKVQAFDALLRGKAIVGDLEHAFEIVRSRPHGHVAAVLGALRAARLEPILARTGSRKRDLCVAMIVSRVIAPSSKLATARGLSSQTAESTLGEWLRVEDADANDCYAAMDWLLERQGSIEQALAKLHLSDGALVLYDVTSTYFEGRTCPLAKLGYSRDGKRDKPQIVIGLLTNGEGCPVAVEVFEGNTADPKTLGPQIQKLRERFALKRIVIVGDRGMITDARIREDLSGQAGLDWITCLRAPAIAKLREKGSLQLSLFDQQDLAEITDPDYPGERLIVCKNPLLAEERTRKRRALLEATERDLKRIEQAVARPKRALRGRDRIGLRVGKVLGRFKMGKHFQLAIEDNTFRWQRDEAGIATEALLDGIYIVRTTVDAAAWPTADVVRSYKRLAHVERAFRSLKTVDLNIHPIHHRKAERVRAHVLLCMLSYYVEWHMRRALAPLLFEDDDRAGAQARRESVVAPARRSERAQAKAATKRTTNGETVQSFTSILRNLGTIVRNTIKPKMESASTFEMITRPTPLQQRALDFLGVGLYP